MPRWKSPQPPPLSPIPFIAAGTRQALLAARHAAPRLDQRPAQVVIFDAV